MLQFIGREDVNQYVVISYTMLVSEKAELEIEVGYLYLYAQKSLFPYVAKKRKTLVVSKYFGRKEKNLSSTIFGRCLLYLYLISQLFSYSFSNLFFMIRFRSR